MRSASCIANPQTKKNTYTIDWIHLTGRGQSHQTCSLWAELQEMIQPRFIWYGASGCVSTSCDLMNLRLTWRPCTIFSLLCVCIYIPSYITIIECDCNWNNHSSAKTRSRPQKPITHFHAPGHKNTKHESIEWMGNKRKIIFRKAAMGGIRCRKLAESALWCSNGQRHQSAV